tara:strand:+ start:652 stop:957 length:306 start_codon:yes stop_codon:yes gene_type:complete
MYNLIEICYIKNYKNYNVIASEIHRTKEICGTINKDSNCIEIINNLPPINISPNSNIPIPIKVIPYSKNNIQRNYRERKRTKNKRRITEGLRDDDSYLYNW